MSLPCFLERDTALIKYRPEPTGLNNSGRLRGRREGHRTVQPIRVGDSGNAGASRCLRLIPFPLFECPHSGKFRIVRKCIWPFSHPQTRRPSVGETATVKTSAPAWNVSCRSAILPMRASPAFAKLTRLTPMNSPSPPPSSPGSVQPTLDREST